MDWNLLNLGVNFEDWAGRGGGLHLMSTSEEDKGSL